jgi:hypothetical protein
MSHHPMISSSDAPFRVLAAWPWCTLKLAHQTSLNGAPLPPPAPLRPPPHTFICIPGVTCASVLSRVVVDGDVSGDSPVTVPSTATTTPSLDGGRGGSVGAGGEPLVMGPIKRRPHMPSEAAEKALAIALGTHCTHKLAVIISCTCCRPEEHSRGGGGGRAPLLWMLMQSDRRTLTTGDHMAGVQYSTVPR